MLCSFTHNTARCMAVAFDVPTLASYVLPVSSAGAYIHFESPLAIVVPPVHSDGPGCEVTDVMRLDVTREASHERVIEFFSHLIRHHNCTSGPFATHLETAEEELSRVVADRDWLAASLASMTDKFNAAMEQVVAKTCQGAAFQRQLTAYQKQNAAHVRQAKGAVLQAQAAEARAAEAEARAARAEAKVAALEAKVATMDASSVVGSGELVSAQDMVLKIKEWRECAKKAQCDLQKQERLTKKFAVRLAVYEPHAINEFLASVKPDPIPGVPTIVLTPPSWEFTPDAQSNVDPALLSPRPPQAPRPQTSRFWSSPAPSFTAPPSRKGSLKSHSSPGSNVTPSPVVQSAVRVVRPLPRRGF